MVVFYKALVILRSMRARDGISDKDIDGRVNTVNSFCERLNVVVYNKNTLSWETKLADHNEIVMPTLIGCRLKSA